MPSGYLEVTLQSSDGCSLAFFAAPARLSNVKATCWVGKERESMAIARVRALTREKPQSTDDDRLDRDSALTRVRMAARPAAGRRHGPKGARRAAVGVPTGQSNPPGPPPAPSRCGHETTPKPVPLSRCKKRSSSAPPITQVHPQPGRTRAARLDRSECNAKSEHERHDDSGQGPASCG